MATQTQITQNMISQLKALDPSISADIGTPERMLIETVAQALADAQVDLNILQGAFDIDSKIGTDLDNFLALFAFGRQQGSRATGYVTLSRNDAAPADITIPRGTQLRAAGASSDSHDVIFYTSSAALILQNGTQVVVPIECSIPGSFGNVAANTITEAYQSPIVGITSINNDYATTGGTDIESDEEVKARFKATGPFRNVSGTESQYLATAIATLAKKAIIVGPVSKQREYFQIPLKPDNDGTGNSAIVNQYTTALSANNNAKYVYNNNYYVINESTTPVTHYKKDFDFIFNSDTGSTTSKNRGDAYREYQSGVPGAINPTSDSANGKPNFTFTNVWSSTNIEGKPTTALAPGDVVLTEHSYLSSASRNDYNLGIMNCVDVYVNNNDYQSASTTIPRPGLGVPTFLFTGDDSDAFYIENFRRLGDPEHRPVIGNIFTPLYQQPSADVPAFIEISDTTYYKGIHYWAVEDVTSLRNTIRARNGIEWSSTIKGQRTDLDADLGPYTGQLALAGNIFANSLNIKGKVSKTGNANIGTTAFEEGDSTFDLAITETNGVTIPVQGMYISGAGLGSETIIDTIGTSSTVTWSGIGTVTKYPITIKLSDSAVKFGWYGKVASASSATINSINYYTYVCSEVHNFQVGSNVTVQNTNINYDVSNKTITSVSSDGKAFTIQGTTNPAAATFASGRAFVVTHDTGDYVTYDPSSDGTLNKTFYCKSAVTNSNNGTYPPAYKIVSAAKTGTGPSSYTYTFTISPKYTGQTHNLVAGQRVIVSGVSSQFNGIYTIDAVNAGNNTFTVNNQTTNATNVSNSTTGLAVDSRNWADATKAIANGNVNNVYSFGYPVTKNTSTIYLPNSYNWPLSGTIKINNEYIKYAEAIADSLTTNVSVIKLIGLSRGENGTVAANHPIASYVSLHNSSTDTYFTIDNYIYDNNIQVLQGALEGVKQITTDVLAHQASVRYFKPDVTIMTSAGMSQSTVKTFIKDALMSYFETQYFGSLIQLSDILQVIHNAPGVDNVKWSRDALRPWSANKSYTPNSYVIDNDTVYYSKYGVSTNTSVSPSTSSPISYSVASANSSGTTYVYTLNTSENNGLKIGDRVTVTGSNIDAYNGDFAITAVSTSPKTFTVTGPIADPDTPSFGNSGIVTNTTWIVADPRNKLTETNIKGEPIVKPILDRIQVGGDGNSKTQYNFYFSGSAVAGNVPVSGMIRFKIYRTAPDGTIETKYADLDIGNIAFKTSADSACAYIKAQINGASPNLIGSVVASSSQKIPDSLHQFIITFADSNRTEVIEASSLSLVGNFGSYNYDFDLSDDELAMIPQGITNEETATLDLDSVITVRFRSQSTWNVE